MIEHYRIQEHYKVEDREKQIKSKTLVDVKKFEREGMKMTDIWIWVGMKVIDGKNWHTYQTGDPACGKPYVHVDVPQDLVRSIERTVGIQMIKDIENRLDEFKDGWEL